MSPAPGVESRNDGAYTFNGTNAHVAIPLRVGDNLWKNTNDSFATSFWFKTSQPNAGLFSLTSEAENPTLGTEGLNVYLSGGKVLARFDSETAVTTANLPATASLSYSDGQWHHVLYSFTNNASGSDAHRLYVDGVFIGQNATLGTMPSNLLFAQLGYARDASTPWLNGQLDEVRIYRGAASNLPDASPNSQVAILASKTWEGRESGVIALEGKPFLRVVDLSGNKINDVTPFSTTDRLHWLDLSNNHLVSIDPLAGQWIIDTRDVGYSETSSAWSGDLNSNAFERDYRIVASSNGQATAKYKFTNLPAFESTGLPIEYDVFVTWPAQLSRTAYAQWDVTGSTSWSAQRNQQVTPNGVVLGGVSWESLGAVSAASDRTLSVTLSDQDGNLLLGNLAADAVRLERRVLPQLQALTVVGNALDEASYLYTNTTLANSYSDNEASAFSEGVRLPATGTVPSLGNIPTQTFNSSTFYATVANATDILRPYVAPAVPPANVVTNVVINTDTLAISGNDNDGDTARFFGALFTFQNLSGVATLRTKGSINITTNVLMQGERPFSLQVGGDINISAVQIAVLPGVGSMTTPTLAGLVGGGDGGGTATAGSGGYNNTSGGGAVGQGGRNSVNSLTISGGGGGGGFQNVFISGVGVFPGGLGGGGGGAFEVIATGSITTSGSVFEASGHANTFFHPVAPGSTGAGGTVKLMGTVVDVDSATVYAVRGIGNGPLGEMGRYVLAYNADYGSSTDTNLHRLQRFTDSAVNSTLIRSTNPYLGNAQSPNIVGLIGGGESFGLLTQTAKDIFSETAVTALASKNTSIIATRVDGGWGYSYPGYDMVLIANISNVPWNSPSLGINGRTPVSLKTGGWQYDTLFGGSGVDPNISSLLPGQVFATLIPEAETSITFGANVIGGAPRQTSFSLVDNQIAYLTNSLVIPVVSNANAMNFVTTDPSVDIVKIGSNLIATPTVGYTGVLSVQMTAATAITPGVKTSGRTAEQSFMIAIGSGIVGATQVQTIDPSAILKPVQNPNSPAANRTGGAVIIDTDGLAITGNDNDGNVSKFFGRDYSFQVVNGISALFVKGSLSINNDIFITGQRPLSIQSGEDIFLSPTVQVFVNPAIGPTPFSAGFAGGGNGGLYLGNGSSGFANPSSGGNTTGGGGLGGTNNINTLQISGGGGGGGGAPFPTGSGTIASGPGGAGGGAFELVAREESSLI